jgi:tRNA(Ile)-lysidine synthase
LDLLDTTHLPDGIPVVVACSGGGDSMALLHLVAEAAGRYGWQPSVAHLDHGLRPESAEDAAFVADQAADLALPYHAGSADVDALRRNGESPESAARRIRYRFLQQVRGSAGNRARIVTAHTADDQAETLAMRLERGAALRGMRGILPIREDGVVRPLLGVRRDRLRALLRQEDLAWREDPTNRDVRILRNRWRRSIAGLDAHDQVELVDLSASVTRMAGRTYDVLGKAAAWWLEQCSARSMNRGRLGGPGGLFAGEILLERPPGGVHLGWSDQALLDVALEAIGADPRVVSLRSRMELLRMLRGDTTNERTEAGVAQLGDDIWAESVRDGLLMASGADPHWGSDSDWEEPLIFSDEGGSEPNRRRLPRGGTLSARPALSSELERVCQTGSTPDLDGRSRVIIDGDVIGQSVTLRYARTGDWLQPFGMKGRKRLADLFGEEGVPRLRRGRHPVVTSNDRILWVAGVRASELGRVTTMTRQGITLDFETQH